MNRAKLTHIGSTDVRGTRTRTPGLTEARIRRSVFRILQENLLCSIATVSLNLAPQEAVLVTSKIVQQQDCHPQGGWPLLGLSSLNSIKTLPQAGQQGAAGRSFCAGVIPAP